MLDIIIPTYKNKDGLRRTLQSINTALLNEIKVHVIDDCSNLDYNNIINEFPFIHLNICPKNSGPGMARNTMMLQTSEPYILFIDTGDTFLSDDVQVEMLQTIKQNPDIYFFSWQHIEEEKQEVCKDTHNRLHGRVYSREFLQKYNIQFAPKGSYANEDIGFNRTCRIFLEDKYKDNHYLLIHTPIILWEYNADSITKRNNREFNYASQNLGLAWNEIHLFETCCAQHVSSTRMQKEAGDVMGSLYHGVYKTAQERPEFVQQAWDGAYLFYHQVYVNYEHTGAALHLQATFSKIMRDVNKNKEKWSKNIPLNIKRFLADLKQSNIVPKIYI